MQIRQLQLFDQEILSEGGRVLKQPSRRVAAAALLHNPYAGKPAIDDFADLVDISVRCGEILTSKVMTALAGLQPIGYGKGALVGTAGDLEHGAAMIHVRIGLAMRKGAGGGPALIPGNAKTGGAGTPIDIIFGGIEDGWDYDAMDSMTIVYPDGPRPDEILLIVAFLAGGRPNARIRGASQQAVEKLVREMRS